MSNGNTTLTLNTVPGATYGLEFDFYAIDSWEGNDTPTRPDYLNIFVDNTQVFQETFSNFSDIPQTYNRQPDIGGVNNNLGFSSWDDSIYRKIPITFTAIGSTTQIRFADGGLQGLSDESWGIDNVRVWSDELANIPDLQVESVVVPSAALFGQNIDLSWTVSNIGNVDAVNEWRDSLWLSKDTNLSSDDISLLTQSQNQFVPLITNGHYTDDATVTIPFSDVLPYEIEENNSIATANNLSPNFTSNGVDANTYIAEVGGEISTSGERDFFKIFASPGDIITLEEFGSPSGKGTLRDTYVYFYDKNGNILSQNDDGGSGLESYLSYRIPDSNYIGDYYIRAGAFSSRTGTYTLKATLETPNLITSQPEEGTYYILTQTDADGNQIELDETNNVYASQPITLVFSTSKPDLTITATASQTKTVPGGSTEVSWTVTNTSTDIPALADWFDYVYISEDDQLDNSDTPINFKSAAQKTPLAPGESYTFQENVTLPNITGDRYLLFVVDGNNNQIETDENNNVYTIPIKLRSPDLLVSDTTAPDSAILNQPFTVSWQVTNQEDIEASADWFDYVYLSDHTIFDSSDISLGSNSAAPYIPLASNASYIIERDITISDTSKQGKRYLLFVTDRNNNQLESNENNNYVWHEIEIKAPDLLVESVVVPPAANIGQTIDITWTVSNNGTSDVTAPWSDRIWLSKDTSKSNDDIELVISDANTAVPLAITNSDTRTVPITLPLDVALADDSYYIFVETDVFNNSSEFNENNNVGFSTQAITITLPPLPDLEVSNIVIPDKARSGESIDISWTVTNTGDAYAASSWADRVYLSKDGTLNDAILIDTLRSDADLASGQQYTTPTRKVLLPEVTDGDYQIVVVSDFDNEVFEGRNENNNLRISDTTMRIGRVDLVPTITSSPTTATSGTTVSLEWSITNAGSAESPSSWVDHIYLSTDDKFDTNDLLLNERLFDDSLSSNSSYLGQLDIDLPLEISGNRYLLLVTDADEQIKELGSEDNNVTASAIQIELADYADLEVSEVTVIESAIGNPATINVGWKVSNVGTGAGITGEWVDRVIASVDEVIGNSDDIELATFAHNGLLDTNQFYNASKDIQLPANFEGRYNLYVQTGIPTNENSPTIFENGFTDNNFDSAQNQFFVATKEYADLIVTDINTGTTTEAQTGETLRLEWTVANQGLTVTDNNSWSDYVVLYDSDGNQVKSEYYERIGFLNNGDTYSRQVDFVIPKEIEAGNYYFGVTAAYSGAPYEAIFDDNNSEVSEQTINISRSPSPNLVVEEVTTVSSIEAGKKIDVTWKVINQGNADASDKWFDEVYLQSAGVDNPSTIYLGRFGYGNGLEPNKFYERSEQFTIPERIDGAYDVIVRNNSTNSLYEDSATDDNTTTADNQLVISLPPHPDLQVSDILVPGEVKAGGKASGIEFTVTNRGTIAATETWYDNVYLSLDGDISSDDILIGSFQNQAALDPVNGDKTSYRTVVNESFDIPRYLRGEAYIIVRTDAGNSINEYPRDDNNIESQKLIVEPIPPADLVTSNVVAPVQAFEGSEIKVKYIVTNKGSGETDRDRWTDSVWLTRQPNKRPSALNIGGGVQDIQLGTFTHNGSLKTENDLDSSNYYDGEVNVTLPNQISGEWYITVWSDANEEITEDTFDVNSNPDDANELNNNNYASTSIKVLLTPSADLVVTNVDVETNDIEGGQPFKVSWNVQNEGLVGTTEDFWYDNVYISDKPTLDEDGANQWFIGSSYRDGKLSKDDTYTGELETVLSPGVTGKYVIIKTDGYEYVWEGIYEDNNQKNTDINVTSTPADLKVIEVKTLPQNYSGDKTTIEWTVRNDGADVWSGTRYWYDEIWISDKAEFNSSGANQTKIGFVAYSPENGLGAGESYTQQADVVLPVGYDGEYYIHVSTNYSYDRNTRKFRGEIPVSAYNDFTRESFEYRVYENPDNNLGSEAIDVIYREADLKISNLGVSNGTPQSGEEITVNWDIENQGTRDTRENQWYDRIYLSQDESLDYGDVFLGEYRRKGSLNVGNSYQASTDIILPEGIDGDYNLLVFADSNLVKRDEFSIRNEFVDSKLARVPEFLDENNNIASIALPVTLRPAADLQVTSVSILTQPPTATIGQSFDIKYTVENKGVGATPEIQDSWNDLIYLSRDEFLDLQSDRYLGYVTQDDITLQPGEGYSVEKTLQAPFNLDGSYYVFVITDAPERKVRGKVYEGVNENNNATPSVQPLIINRPPAVDLKVTNITATPTAGNVGDSINIEWDVINDSENTTQTLWSDAVYLSEDSEWDVNDTFVGSYSYTGNALNDNETYTADITANLPSATPGQYRFIVRTDVFNQLYEGQDIGELNNDSVAESVFNVSAQELQLNVIKEDIALDGGQEKLFEIDVEANQTLRITLDGEKDAFNEVFVNFGDAPTVVNYEVASTGIIDDRQIATISNTKQGKYYVLVRSIEGNSSGVTLFAEELPFGISDIATDRGGDSRFVSTNIYGAQFKKGAAVKLVRPGIAEYLPVNYKVVNNTQISAIFDLTDAPHGLYDVKVINPDNEEAILPYRYLVERAIEQDVTVGLGGPRVLALEETGTYGVSLQSLTNIDTPYVHFQVGIPELGENPILDLPYVEFTSNLRGEPDANLLDDLPWASLISDVNTDGRILAPGYVLDLPNAGYVGRTFNVQNYPGLEELVKKQPGLLADAGGGDIAFKFNILATATVMSRDEFIAEQTEEALKLRTAILTDTEASPGLINLASSEETWTNSYLAALESAGLLRSEDDKPPIRENNKVISLMATLTSGLLLGPVGDEIITDGDLVNFFAKVREWYGHTPEIEAGNEIPDLTLFDKGLSKVTHTSAFKVFVPFKDAKLDLPQGVSVPPPSFNSFFSAVGSTSELANLTGPIGFGNENFVPLDTQLPYTINFENAATASDAVGEVRIVTKLDEDLDPRSFQLGDLRLGDIQVNIPTGRSFFQENFDFTAAKGFILRVSAGLDIESNTVTWLLQAIDPKTGEVVKNTDIGLLLPNNAEGIGKAFVSYTVLPKADIATGAEITSTARIIYNTAAPIDTEETINIVDGEAPSTTINVKSLSGVSNVSESPSPHLQSVKGSSDYLVNWEAIDDEAGSGVKHVTVYVAENGGDFKIWVSQTSDTEAVFNGKADTTYEFLALATDNAGNKEQPDLGITPPSDGSTVNLGTLPTVGETTKPEIPTSQPSQPVSTNELFIKAQAETPNSAVDTNKPEFDTVLRPFTAQAFATNIPQSHADVGAMAIAVLPNGNVIASGGSNRGSLYRFDKEGGVASNPFTTLKYPVFDLALDNNGFLWGVTGGSSLIKLDSESGEIVKEYGDSITTGLAINPSSGLIYVASGNGIEVFNSNTETFTHYSDIRVDNLAINPRDGKLWATTYPERGNVISFNEDGKAQRMVEYDSPIDSIAFGKEDSQLDNLLFVSDNSGKLHMVDTLSLQSITIATGGSRGEIVETTLDGKVLVSQSNQIDIFNPVLAPEVKATNPAPGSTVALPQGTINVTFDADMFEGNVNDAASVLNPANYQLIDADKNIINPLSVKYDKNNRTALLEFNGINPGEYSINILPSLENSAGLKMENVYNTLFTAVSNFSDLVDFEFSNPRSNRQNQTVSYDVTITNTADQDLQLPLMLVLDPELYFNGEVQDAISQNDNGAFLVDLQDSLENGTLKVGESITNRTITVFNPDAYRVELAPGIYTLPYDNAAPTLTSNPITVAITFGRASLNANTEYNYQIQASDADGAEFGYLLYDSPEGMSVSENGLITWQPTQESDVNTKVEIYVFDKRGGYTKQEFTINVAGGNNKPVFNNITAISGASVTIQNPPSLTPSLPPSFIISAK
ncbi:MAG: CARDB domain-containing protein, partial [Rivularia sp. (in: cyanobacteria)]